MNLKSAMNLGGTMNLKGAMNLGGTVKKPTAKPQTLTSAKINPKFKHHCRDCLCLGEAVINGTAADLFVCSDTVIARFSDAPDAYEASHLQSLSALSSPYLLTAFRLYLDARGEAYRPTALRHPAESLQS